MKPKRVFQVYQENGDRGEPIDVTTVEDACAGKPTQWAYMFAKSGAWRFRVLAPRAPVAHRIVGGSGEAFDSKSNAMRAARREASLYPPGVAAVEIEGHGK